MHGPVCEAAPVGTGGAAVTREEEIMLHRCRRVGCRDWATVALEPFGPRQLCRFHAYRFVREAAA